MKFNNKLTLYQGNDELEISQLRSVLLFSEFGRTNKRTDMLPQVFLSYIIMAGGEASYESITEQFNTNFGMTYKISEVKDHVNKLIKQNLVECVGNNLIFKIEDSENDRFFNNLNDETNSLVANILERYRNLLGVLDLTNEEIVKKNIINALSEYFRYTSLSIVNSSDIPAINDSTKNAFKYLTPGQGERLIMAIGEGLNNPSEQEKRILNKWARAHILTQILKIDPTLNNFKATLINKKSFVLDTDIVLHLVCSHTRYSAMYKELVSKLMAIGCKIYVPKEVLKEVEFHAKYAISRYKRYDQEQFDNFTDYELYNSASNVFVEDFVLLRRADSSKKSMTFDTYIHNICYEGHPYVLKNKIESIIKDNINNELQTIEIDQETEENLKMALIEQASSTTKGAIRSSAIIESLSEFDAHIFCQLRELDKDCKEQGLLRAKYYFLTQSMRTVRVARDLMIDGTDIICRPEALAIVLTEIGQLPKENFSVFNLFENTFLVHAADVVWERIEPILDEGVQLSYKELNQLRADVDVRFDDFLSSSSDKKVEFAHKYKGKYKFLEDYNNAIKENLLLKAEHRKMKNSREENQKTIEKLKKEINSKTREIHYLRLMSNKKRTKENVRKKR